MPAHNVYLTRARAGQSSRHTTLSSWPGVDNAGKGSCCDLCPKCLGQREPQVTQDSSDRDKG